MVSQRSMVDIFSLSLRKFLIIKMKINKWQAGNFKKNQELAWSSGSMQLLFEANTPNI